MTWKLVDYCSLVLEYYESVNKTTLEFGRLTSMGRSGGGRSGTKGGHVGYSCK